MAWESRGSHHYFYRKRREGRRVVSEYLGNGAAANLTSILTQQEREEHEIERSGRRIWQAELAEVEQQTAELARIIQTFLSATLLISDFHPHKGQWRRRRHAKRSHSRD
jgi:hypothetical protein